MQAIQVGMLRSTGELSTLKDIAVETDKFGIGAVKFTMEQEAVEVNLESSRDSGLVMIKNKLPLDELNDAILSSTIYRELVWDFGTDYTPVSIAINIHQVEESGQNIFARPVEVKDLDQPIFFQLPMDKDVALTCAYFNEISQQWKALQCPKESY